MYLSWSVSAYLDANSVIIHDLTETCEEQIIASYEGSKSSPNALKYDNSTTENGLWSCVIHSDKVFR